mmetsp:Transcript_55073/g.134810  ORF Transcript_55073/g.134810 Transcript_55073/m.134810 type:complete len:109 (+) Transcript_55073:246-572(+)
MGGVTTVSRSDPDFAKCRKLPVQHPSVRHRTWQQWAHLKYVQYTITSGLYVLDWWEKIVFNLVIGCILVATLLATYIYFHDSVPLFFLISFLFGFIVFLLLLCPLHQY